jgi:hypothetical protein
MVASLFAQYKGRILATYALLLFEMFLFALLPFLLGKAVDSLLLDHYRNFFIYLSASAAGLALGYGRRCFDTRCFTRIWASKSVKCIDTLMRHGVDSTKIVSRSHMLADYTNFFEYTIPQAATAVSGVVVSLVMLWIFVPETAGVVLVLALTSILVSYRISHLNKRCETQIQRLLEEVNTSIEDTDAAGVNKGYQDMNARYIRLSDLDALNWGVNDVLKVVAEVLVILSCVRGGQSVGTITTTITYTYTLFAQSGLLSVFLNQLQILEMNNRFLNDKQNRVVDGGRKPGVEASVAGHGVLV